MSDLKLFSLAFLFGFTTAFTLSLYLIENCDTMPHRRIHDKAYDEGFAQSECIHKGGNKVINGICVLNTIEPK
jgi:hypothetical protein